MAQGRWTRKCQDCGWVEPGASYPSKEFAEPNVDAGFGELEPRAPRMPRVWFVQPRGRSCGGDARGVEHEH